MSVGPIYVCESTNRNGSIMSLYHLYSPANSVANFLHFGSRVHPEINTIFRQVYLHFSHKTKWNKGILRNSTSCVLCVSVSMSHMCVCVCARVCEHVYICRGDHLSSASACHVLSWQILSVYEHLCMSDGKHPCRVTSSVLIWETCYWSHVFTSVLMWSLKQCAPEFEICIWIRNSPKYELFEREILMSDVNHVRADRKGHNPFKWQ